MVLGLYYYHSLSGNRIYFPISIDHEKKYLQLLHASASKASHWQIKRRNYEDVMNDGKFNAHMELVIYED